MQKTDTLRGFGASRVSSAAPESFYVFAGEFACDGEANTDFILVTLPCTYASNCDDCTKFS